jgi:hypothetical protein
LTPLACCNTLCLPGEIPKDSEAHFTGARGIERRKIFRDDKDRKSFLDRLAIILEETQTQCYVYPVKFSRMGNSTADLTGVYPVKFSRMGNSTADLTGVYPVKCEAIFNWGVVIDPQPFPSPLANRPYTPEQSHAPPHDWVCGNIQQTS